MKKGDGLLYPANRPRTLRHGAAKTALHLSRREVPAPRLQGTRSEKDLFRLQTPDWLSPSNSPPVLVSG